MSEHKNNEVLDSDGLVEVIIESDEPSDTSCSDDEQLHSIPVVKKISKFIKMIKCLILCLKDTKNYLWWRRIEEEEELDYRVFNIQIDHIVKSYITQIKVVILLLIFLNAIVVVVYYAFGITQTKYEINFVQQLCHLLIYLTLSIAVIHIFPNVTPYLIPVTIMFFMFLTTQISTAGDEYKFSEYFMTNCLGANMLVVMLPSQWKANSLAFIAGMIYLWVNMFFSYQTFSFELVMSSILGSIYFCITWLTLYCRMRSLYVLIAKNQKLINEMKRLLQVFPESIIIRANGTGTKRIKKYYANRHFTTRICDIKEEIKNIDKIEWNIDTPKSGSDESESFKTYLHAFLKQQEDKIKDKKFVEWKSMQMKCSDKVYREWTGLDSDISIESNIRHFQVKTLQIRWEGDTSAFLHVFVDITDIKKLEEATNNIKCQKIMFASVSHEF